GFSGGILLGYWADLDGDDTIRLDETELCEGRWMTREELELDSAAISLTREMMKYFKETKNI
ncbi:MAG: NAD(+) diphosphatase, partial [Lachnospiraceae bacterium]|nr:NAD(+) diphosphatase [Lachnospiraceae bacterium]